MQQISQSHQLNLVGLQNLLLQDQTREHGEACETMPEEMCVQAAGGGPQCQDCQLDGGTQGLV